MSLTLRQIQVPYITADHSEVWNTNIEFNAGEFTHIKAPSGKGKSTFVACLYGLQKNYRGDLFFHQQSLKSLSVSKWCKLRTKQISIVFQDLKLFEDNTAFENIELKRSMTDYYPPNTIHTMAKMVGIENVLQRPVHTLSYGERQRVAILRALMQPFEVLLLDEPFSHLDESNIALAAKLIDVEVRKRKATLILTDLDDDNRFDYHHKLCL